MIPILGVATPKSEPDKQKMIEQIGRDHFYFKGQPTDFEVHTPSGCVVALRWDFIQLDPLMRICMTLNCSLERRMSLEAADVFLTETGAFFIKAEFDLTETDKEVEEWNVL